MMADGIACQEQIIAATGALTSAIGTVRKGK